MKSMGVHPRKGKRTMVEMTRTPSVRSFPWHLTVGGVGVTGCSHRADEGRGCGLESAARTSVARGLCRSAVVVGKTCQTAEGGKAPGRAHVAE